MAAEAPNRAPGLVSRGCGHNSQKQHKSRPERRRETAVLSRRKSTVKGWEVSKGQVLCKKPAFLPSHENGQPETHAWVLIASTASVTWRGIFGTNGHLGV